MIVTYHGVLRPKSILRIALCVVFVKLININHHYLFIYESNYY